MFVTAEVGNQTRDAGAAAREMQRYGIGLKYLNECTLLHLRMARLRRRCGEGPREAGRPHERRAESYSRTPPGVKVHARNVLRSDGPRPMHRARFRVFRATTIVVGLITVRPCRSAPIAALRFTNPPMRTALDTTDSPPWAAGAMTQTDIRQPASACGFRPSHMVNLRSPRTVSDGGGRAGGTWKNWRSDVPAGVVLAAQRPLKDTVGAFYSQRQLPVSDAKHDARREPEPREGLTAIVAGEGICCHSCSNTSRYPHSLSPPCEQIAAASTAHRLLPYRQELSLFAKDHGQSSFLGTNHQIQLTAPRHAAPTPSPSQATLHTQLLITQSL